MKNFVFDVIFGALTLLLIVSCAGAVVVALYLLAIAQWWAAVGTIVLACILISTLMAILNYNNDLP
ncbi:hypothetical protein D3C81_1194910 [compost metagenome]